MSLRIRQLLYNAKLRAATLGVPFSISMEDLGDISQCAATGLPFDISLGIHEGNMFGPSIDRIVPSVGYVPGNVRVVIHAYNTAKGAGTDEGVLRMAKALLARHAP